eukprot:TRINITY_DN8553_c0_g1_i1.p2 TRINITY_DN8553_c0_g1~~TRINITY_DN8553_c0_g1_i1.p2  ORF type:complete len:408 (+),score=114.09 TRINITY_DN8553_c0_g1_i1:78-1301(+)
MVLAAHAYRPNCAAADSWWRSDRRQVDWTRGRMAVRYTMLYFMRRYQFKAPLGQLLCELLLPAPETDLREEPISDLYDIMGRIERGSHASVVEGISRLPICGGPAGTPVALKIARKNTGFGYGAATAINRREALVMERLMLNRLQGHPSIVRYFHCCETETEACLVLERMDRDLHCHIKSAPLFQLPMGQVREVSRAVLGGLLHLHNLGIAHRDIKPENILVASNHGQLDRVRIADFGLAVCFNVSDPEGCCDRTTLGTSFYMAPEMLNYTLTGAPRKGLKVCLGVDLFSFGVVLYTMCAGRPPWLQVRPGKLGFSALLEAHRRGPNFVSGRDAQRWGAVPAGARTLTAKLLAFDPVARITAQEAVADEWVRDAVAQPSRPPSPELVAPPSPGQDRERHNAIVAARE